ERAGPAARGSRDGEDPGRRHDRIGHEGRPRALRGGRLRRLHHQADRREELPRPDPRLSEGRMTGRPKILGIDDTPENLRLLEAILTPRGYDLVTASSGAAG